jgi:CRP-like cAMP-binding protein
VPIDAKTIIERNRLFRGLHLKTIEQIAALASRRTYKSGAVVFMRGDPGDALYGVALGSVRISANSAGGKEVSLNVMEPGDTFGEIALLDGQPRTATATTLSATELIIVQRPQFIALLQQQPQLAVHLIELLCKRVRWTSEQVEDTSFLAAPARIAKRLISLAQSHGRPAPKGIQLKLSQEELAQFLGLSRQAVNKHLQVWKRKHWISLGRGSILVTNQEALLKFTQSA